MKPRFLKKCVEFDLQCDDCCKECKQIIPHHYLAHGSVSCLVCGGHAVEAGLNERIVWRPLKKPRQWKQKAKQCQLPTVDGQEAADYEDTEPTPSTKRRLEAEDVLLLALMHKFPVSHFRSKLRDDGHTATGKHKDLAHRCVVLHLMDSADLS